MPGPPKPRRFDQPVAVSLGDPVPSGRFTRRPERTPDLNFGRDRPKGCCAGTGTTWCRPRSDFGQAPLPPRPLARARSGRFRSTGAGRASRD